jgi:predicted transcriptional regulator
MWGQPPSTVRRAQLDLILISDPERSSGLRLEDSRGRLSPHVNARQVPERPCSARPPPGIKFTLDFIRMKRIFHFRASSSQLGPLEERLLEALWQRGSATVRDMVDGACPDLAYTTVMTTLDRLFKKNLLSREAEGRAFRYAPRFTREELHREVAGEAFRQLLDASPASSLPLSYLVEILTERDAQLLDDLRRVVEAKRRALRNLEARDESQSKDKA